MKTLALLVAAVVPTHAYAQFQAGATVVEIAPPKLPVLVNGGMLSRYVNKINTRVNARALVLSDGKTRAASRLEFFPAPGTAMRTTNKAGFPKHPAVCELQFAKHHRTVFNTFLFHQANNEQ